MTANRNSCGEKTTGYNSTYPKGGVSYFADSFVGIESLVHRMKFSGKNPALRVAANRYQQFLHDPITTDRERINK